MYLLTQYVDCDIKNQDGSTLLHLACNNINALPLDVFKYLIETKGYDVNVQDNKDATPIHLAIRCFRNKHGDVNILTYLLKQNNFNVKLKDSFNRTLLHQACVNMENIPFEIFEYLIETKRANVDDCDRLGQTSLHHLMISIATKPDDYFSQVTQYLIQKGATINQKNKRNLTILDMFLSHSSTEKHPLTYQVLIRNGAKKG
jgi:ankyrin repeat protein